MSGHFENAVVQLLAGNGPVIIRLLAVYIQSQEKAKNTSGGKKDDDLQKCHLRYTRAYGTLQLQKFKVG